jgi:hypothetical protein
MDALNLAGSSTNGSPSELRILRPSDTWRGRLDGQHLSRSRSRNLGDVLHATPLSRYQKQSSVAHAPSM